MNELLKSDFFLVLIEKVKLKCLFDGKVLIVTGQFVYKVRDNVLLTMYVCCVRIIEKLKKIIEIDDSLWMLLLEVRK